jgi:predicted DNA-binding transcriptional regulator AlpA
MSTLTKPQLLNAKEIAAMLHVSERHLWRLKAAGKVPKPVKVGECVRWLLRDIEAWLEMGCPSQKEFDHRKNASRRK